MACSKTRSFLLACSALLFACGSPDPSAPAEPAETILGAPAIGDVAPARQAWPMQPIRNDDPRASLDDLLRLPAGTGSVDTLAERLKPELPRQAESTQQRFRLRVQRDHAAESRGPAPAREGLGVEASVDLGRDTSVRGGVRTQRESRGGHEDVAPTIGVERRF